MLCNFSFDVSDLQPASEEQAKQEMVEEYRRRSSFVHSALNNAIWASDDRTLYILDAHDCDLFNKFRYRTVYSLGGDAMVDIYENHMLQKCFSVSSPVTECRSFTGCCARF